MIKKSTGNGPKVNPGPAKQTKSEPAIKQKPAPVAPEKPSTKKGGDKKTASSVTTTNVVTGGSVYLPISHHIYYDGYSYRVRASIGGVKYSQNFSSKKKAYEFRKSLGLTMR